MFNYHLFDYEPFDYMAGGLPEELNIAFEDQLYRARIILKGRSNFEVGYGLESLDWMLGEGSVRLFEDIMSCDEVSSRSVSRALALMSFLPSFDIKGQSQLKKAKYQEYFALLVIGVIAETLNLLNGGNTDTLPPEAQGIPPGAIVRSNSYMKHAIEETLEAISFAEGIAFGAALGANSPRSIGKKGGKIRASKFSALRKEVIECYEAKYSRLSDRQAAKLIAKELAKEAKEVLSTPEPEVRFQDWIGKHRRSKKA